MLTYADAEAEGEREVLQLDEAADAEEEVAGVVAVASAGGEEESAVC